MSKTENINMIKKVEKYDQNMDKLRDKLQPYINPVEDAIFGDVAYDLVGDDSSPATILEAEETIEWVLDKKNFLMLQLSLHDLFRRQKSMYYIGDKDEYNSWDYIDRNGCHYSIETEPGESYDLYGYME